MRSFDFLLDSLGLQRATRPATARPDPSRTASRPYIAAYPQVEPGIPAQPVDDVLGAQQDLIDRIKVCYGMDRATFERELLPLIRRYAAFVHLLPATPDNYFNAPGGLLRMGLEVAFFSLQGTDGHIFSGRATIAARRQLEPRWRQATFIAGLCCEIHRTLSHFIVTNEQGDEWQPYLLPLSSWLDRHRVARFFVKWRPDAHESRAAGVFALPHILAGEVLQDLATDNAIIVPHMMASIAGMPLYREHNIVDDLVRRSVALVIDRHLQARADRYGAPQRGSHLERYLVDALRRLVSAHSAWRPNTERSRVWFGSDGLFMVWPNAAADIRQLLEADQLPGIPNAPETMLEILIAAGIVEAKDASQATWQIVPPEGRSTIEAVKLSSPAMLFAGLDPTPQPLAVALCRLPEPTTPPAATNGKRSPSPQLSLPIEPATALQAGAAPPPRNRETAAPPAAAQLALAMPEFKLDAPMRLNPIVRDALAHIVDTLNHDGAASAARTTSSGLFIPLAEFERRHVEPSLALRALTELQMLVQPAGTQSSTMTRDFGDEHEVGLLLDPRFVAGLNPDDFDVPDAGGT